MIIYLTTNLINKKIYVGKDCNNNPNYFGSGNLIQRAIEKYGLINFSKETLEICDADNWNERERYWIKKLNSRDLKVGYNITEGGEGTLGYKQLQKTKDAVSKAHKGIPLTEEHKEKIALHSIWKDKERVEEHRKLISKRMTGIPRTKEWRENASKAGKGRKMPPLSADHKQKLSDIFSGESSPNFGSKRTKESRKRMSDNHADVSGKNNPRYGVIISIETRKKMSDARKAYFAQKRAA